MPTVWINRETTSLRVSSQRLIAESRDEPAVSIPIRDVDRVVINCGHWSLTSQTLRRLLEKEIPIVFLSTQGKPLGMALPPQNTHGHSRLLQYQKTLDEDFPLATARSIVTAKMYNQRRVLQRITSGRPDIGEPPPATRRLTHLMPRAEKADSIPVLLGLEGTASASYYQAWAGFLPDSFPFERRSRRPPLNPVNAVLSYTSTILYHEVVAAIFSTGLDPALGLLHATENGRFSLALDLLEPYRPVLAESLTLDLFSRSMLQQKHFENRDDGVFLNAAGRGILFLQYERRMERQFLSEHFGHRTTLRQSIALEASNFKTSLGKPQPLQPFRMN